MGYVIELNYLLKLPKEFDSSVLKIKQQIVISKHGERLYPLHKPIEFCDVHYQYLGKVEIKKITIEENKTTIEAVILSLFSTEESAVYTKNFIK